ncbi:MAG: leucine-rich repeat protein, partial [Oscillospiraceae bacterium]
MKKTKINRLLKRTAAGILALAMISVPLPAQEMGLPDFGFGITVFADDKGNFGVNNSLLWSFFEENSLLDIDSKLATNGGAMNSWTSASNVPWYTYRNSIESVKIHTKVTSIGNYAFSGYPKIKSVTLLKNVSGSSDITYIGTSAFEKCTSLTSINIPKGVKNIDDNAFAGCTSLESVTVPNTVTRLGTSVFERCISLESAELPDTLTSTGVSTFNSCSNLKSIKIPSNVTSIESFFLSGCSSLTSITIPEKVTSIGNSAFSGCSSLTSITIPEKVTSIGNSAFSGCSSLETIFIPSGLDVSNANIPSTASQIRYTIGEDGKATVTEVTLGTGRTALTIPQSIGNATVAIVCIKDCPTGLTCPSAPLIEYSVNNSEATITKIVLPTGQNKFDLPDNIGGYPITAVAADYRQYVGNHTHNLDSNHICTLCGKTQYVKGITVSPDKQKLNVGGIADLTANVDHDNAIDPSFTWTSSDTSVATVNENGTVKAVAPGTAFIRATANDGSGKYGKCEITVELSTVLSITETEPGSEPVVSKDYTYDSINHVLTILSDKAMTISGTSTTDKIFVQKDISANITLNGVNIDVSGTVDACAFKIADNSTGDVTITLKGTNVLKSANNRAGIQKNGISNSIGKLEIKGDGSLKVSGVAFAAGIGGDTNGSCSKVTISGGTVTAIGCKYGYAAGIGGGKRGSTSDIKITGGSVKASVGCIPTNGTENVYPLTISNPDNKPVTINGKDYTPVNHRELDENDGNLYVFLPARTAENPNFVKVGDTTTKYVYDTEASKWYKIVDTITISIDAPTAGQVLDTSALASAANYTLGAVSWTDGDTTAKFDKEYTAEIVVTANSDCIFGGSLTATVNGETASITDNGDGTATVTYTFEKTGHSITKVNAVDSTCTTDGNTEHYKCSVCNKLFADESGTTETTIEDVTIPAAHKLSHIEAANASCTESGNIEHYKCDVCEKLFTDESGTTETTLEAVTISAIGHTITHIDANDPTCTEDGNIEHYKCDVCG